MNEPTTIPKQPAFEKYTHEEIRAILINERYLRTIRPSKRRTEKGGDPSKTTFRQLHRTTPATYSIGFVFFLH